MTKDLPKAESVDIALLLEGTFPYVRGGVASWVNQIICAFPQYTFACIFIGSRQQDYGEMAYKLPDNVIHFEQHYFYDPESSSAVEMVYEGDEKLFDQMTNLHQMMRNPATREQAIEALRDGVLNSGVTSEMLENQFLYSQNAWDYIVTQYRRFCTDPSFTDYFWTVRSMHKPVWQMLGIMEKGVKAKLYHTISTGYAGFLGALMHYHTGRPLLTSEHGIYTKERMIDLFQLPWIQDNRSVFERDVSQVGYFRDLWIRFFVIFGQMCYDASHHIVALFEGNRQRQIQDGAQQHKTSVIPNGVDIQRLKPLRDLRPAKPPKVLCLLGRVVPIKDIKTFIRAMLTVIHEMPDAQGWIVGPEDENPEYVNECYSLVESLGLDSHVKFLGFQKIEELLPKCGVLILSSISEALPLVVLEGFAAGIPSVTTDVGCCQELIYGAQPEDVALGAAGAVVRIADAPALAGEAIKLLKDDVLWYQAQRAGIARVETYYSREMMVDAYQHLYEKLLEMPTNKVANKLIADSEAICPMHQQGAK